jgi:cell division protein FtsB
MSFAVRNTARVAGRFRNSELPVATLSVTTPPVRMGGGQVLGGALVLAIVAVAVSLVVGEHGIAHLVRLRTERRALADATFTLLTRNQGLRGEIDRLRGDDLYLEGLARRQLGLVRPEEFVYRFRRDYR